MTEFILLRHGQTDWNVARRYQGQSDIPLNPVGIEQAVQASDALANQHFDAVYSSDLQRAKQTAIILADKRGLSVNYDKRLREIGMGTWEGKSFDEILEHHAEDFKRGAEDPTFRRAPGGESVMDVAARACAALDEIATLHPDGRILVVSHGLAVSTLYCLANDIALKHVYDFIPENANPLTIHWKPQNPK